MRRCKEAQVSAETRSVEPVSVLPDTIGPEDRQGHINIIESLGMTNCCHTVGNDTFGYLVAGAEQGWGVVVSAGTSNNCFVATDRAVEGRVTGCGSCLANMAAQPNRHQSHSAVAAAWTKRGPVTALSNLFVEQTGASDVTDLLAGLVRERYRLTPAAAPFVFDAAANGDSVAHKASSPGWWGIRQPGCRRHSSTPFAARGI